MELKDELKMLYLQSSKHSNYQILPNELAEILDIDENKILPTYEKERFAFICSNILLNRKAILDIGGNTGYFTFESIKKGCSHVDYYEGNTLHAEFVNKAKTIFRADNIDVHPNYYLFDEKDKKYDVVFCLNVVHHLGEDFFYTGDINHAKNMMIECVNRLAYITDYLVFQMGYNWCGNRNFCLFKNGTKKEIEHFIMDQTQNYWEIINIGIAEKRGET